jgi:hypothetical protein
MIPPVFFIPPALSWLVAAHTAAAYWRASAEYWAMFQAMTASADIVPFPSAPRASSAAARVNRRGAEIVRFAPGER